MSTTYGLHRALLLNRDGTAVVFEDRRRTFAELADRVARLAGALKALGIAEGDRVAVLSLNQDRYIEFFLGVAWAGAVIVPLNIRWSALENEDALRDCRPKILFVDAAFAAMGREIAERSARCRSSTPTTLSPPARRRCRTMKVCSRPPRRSRTRKRETTSLPASSTPAAPPAAPKA